MNSVKEKSILVVDDIPENLQLLVGMLTDQGYRVRAATNGKHALATVQKELPDLILLDIMMPIMDGYEVCQQLKADERTRDVPVIFISALDGVFDKMTAFSIGAVDYIAKPFQIEEILARVHTHLSLVDMRQKLQLKNQQLQAQNSELDAFAHTVAHDLKSPLSKIVTSLGLVKTYTSTADNKETDYLLEISVRATHKMSNIIDELLLLASVRKEQVQITPVNMDQVVSQALNRLSPMLDKYQPHLTIPNEWPPVDSYAPWLEEVWVNYLSNGLKYGGDPPHLVLGTSHQPDGYIRFWVRDNGKGLGRGAQAKLFTEFTRLDEVRAEGHGLGLSIVRRIMSKLGGQYGVESTPGQGSLFYFTLKQR